MNACCFNAEGVAAELMFQSVTPEFISSSEINLNLIPEGAATFFLVFVMQLCCFGAILNRFSCSCDAFCPKSVAALSLSTACKLNPDLSV